MKFCCVTPCYNAEEHIEYTLISVLSQSVFKDKTNQLFYFVKDGGSTDTTLVKVRAIASKYAKSSNIQIEIISQPDSGMYDALAISFKNLPQGDIYSYINAGDYYSPFAFEIVNEIFTENNVQFLTGLNCVYNEKNHLLSCHLPYKYKKSLLLAGCYGTMLPHVQQESTFWGPRLHQKIDVESLGVKKLAGDFYIWKTFIKYAKLYIVSAQLGGFKIHKGQLTENSKREYKTEVKELAEPGSIWLLLIVIIDKIIWMFPNKLKKRLSNEIFEYDHKDMKYKIVSYGA